MELKVTAVTKINPYVPVPLLAKKLFLEINCQNELISPHLFIDHTGLSTDWIFITQNVDCIYTLSL